MPKTTYFVYCPLRSGPKQKLLIRLEGSGETATFVRNYYPIDAKDCVEVMLLDRERHPAMLIKAKGFDYGDVPGYDLFAQLIAAKAAESIPGGDVILFRNAGTRPHLDGADIRLSLALHEALSPGGFDLRDYILLDTGGYVSSCGDGMHRYPDITVERKGAPKETASKPWTPGEAQIDALIEVMNHSGLNDDDPRMSITNGLLEDLEKVYLGDAVTCIYQENAAYQPYRDAVETISALAKKEESDFAREVLRICNDAACSLPDREAPVQRYTQIDGGDGRNGKFTERIIRKHNLLDDSTAEVKERELLIPFTQTGGASTDRVNVSDDGIREVIANNRLVALQYFRRDDLNFTEVVEIDVKTLLGMFKKK